MKLYIRTPYGNQYHVHENGAIQRLDMYPPDKPFSTENTGWTMQGLQHVKNREYIPLAELFKGKIPDEIHGSSLHYKNGNPQWTVRDLDHGTIREWGNTKYHGIAELRLVEG